MADSSDDRPHATAQQTGKALAPREAAAAAPVSVIGATDNNDSHQRATAPVEAARGTHAGGTGVVEIASGVKALSLRTRTAAEIQADIEMAKKDLEEAQRDKKAYAAVANDSSKTPEERARADRRLDVTLDTIKNITSALDTLRREMLAMSSSAAIASQPPPSPANIAVAAAGVAAAQFDVAHEAEATAATILTDMVLSADLERQRAASGLGPWLRKAIPVSTLDAAGPSAQPILADEYLPYVGGCKEFLDALDLNTVREQDKWPVLAVVQASGSGKTRLAYKAGEHGWFVVLIRLWKQQAGCLTAAWSTFAELAREWALARTKLDTADQRAVSQDAMAAMRLVVASYVEWAVAVVEAVDRRLPSDTDADVRSQQLREAALRSLRNGRGDDAVGRLYRERLSRLRSRAQLGGTVVETIDRTGVAALCKRLNERLQAVLGADARILVWYDEIHALFDTPKVFMALSAFQGSAPQSGSQTCFYGAMALMASLSDDFKWRQAMCGTWLDIWTQARVPVLSPLHGRVVPVFHASRIGVDDMLEVLQTYFSFEDRTVAELHSLLDVVRGRPTFFFDKVFARLWARLDGRWGKASIVMDARAWHEYAIDAVQLGTDAARTTCLTIVREYWTERPVALPDGRSTGSLCAELYAAARLNGGKVRVTSDDTTALALRYGLLALPVASKSSPKPIVQLDAEPLMRDAVVSHGDALASDPNIDNDPIFGLLVASVHSGQIAGFAFTTSVKGDVLEVAFAWHVIRMGLHARDETLRLGDVLGPLLAPGFDVPPHVAERLVAVTGAAPDMSRDGRGTFERVLERPSLASYGIDTHAGADVVFATAASDADTPASLVLVQAKARKAASLVKCLRASSPAWQYTTGPERKQVVDRTLPDNHVWSAKRTAFAQLASAHSQAFGGAVRVALSVNGYQPDAVRVCMELNEEEGGTFKSPIVLCVATRLAFGPALHGALAAACAGGALTSTTKETAYLLPQSVATVQAGKLDPVPEAVDAIVRGGR